MSNIKKGSLVRTKNQDLKSGVVLKLWDNVALVNFDPLPFPSNTGTLSSQEKKDWETENYLKANVYKLSDLRHFY